MRTHVLIVLLAGVVLCNNVQGQTTDETRPQTTETKMTESTTQVSPDREEKGLILGVFDDWGFSYDPAQLRLLYEFPGIDGQNDVPADGFLFPDENIDIRSIGTDYRKSNIYMYDRHNRAIWIATNFSVNANISEMEPNVLHFVSARSTMQLAVDWLSHTVYWCDTALKMVLAASGEWEKVKYGRYKIIASGYLDVPVGITVDPLEGFLFWSDRGTHPMIQRARLDGSERHTIIYTNLKSPDSLEADISSQRIYWIDSYTESIYSAEYDGNDQKFFTREGSSWLYDFAIFRDVIYVTDASGSFLFTLDKRTAEKRSDKINYDYYESIYSVSVYSEETQPLKQRDYCAELMCEHMCVSEKEGAKCLCGEGYRLNPITQKCDEYAGGFLTAFVYANASHICMVNIRSVIQMDTFELECKFTTIKQQQTTRPTTTRQTQTPPQNTSTPRTTPIPPVGLGGGIKKIELDMEDRYVFFVTMDNQLYKRNIDLPIDNDYVEELAVGSGEVSGLAYNPVDRDLYWSQDDGRLYLIKIDDKDVLMLDVDFTPIKPKDLILLIDQRKLAFIAGDANNMSIITMDLDGSNMKVILENYDSITSLSFERETELFYFLLAGEGEIYTLPLDTEQEPDLFTSSLSSSSYILLEYHHFLVWVYNSSTEPNLIKTVDKAIPYSTVGQGFFDQVSTILDLKILDAEKQATKPGPCSKNNGGCSQICISKFVRGQDFKVCECKKGYTMAANKMNCTSEPVRDHFLVINDWSNDEILQIELGTFQLRAIPERESYLYTAVYLDPVTLRIFWSAYYDTYVYSSNLNGSDVKVEADIGDAYPYMFAKDSSTGNIYYTAYYNQHVGVITPSSVNVWLNEEFLFEFISVIEVHPGNGHIYYAVRDTLWEEAYVARSDMDGQNSAQLTQSNLFKDIRGLAIDFIHDHLYVSDFEDDVVMQCDLDGDYCYSFIETTNMQVTELATDGIYLYYASYKQDYLVRVDLKQPDNSLIIGKGLGLGKVNTLSLYSSRNMNIQPVDNACLSNNGLGDCSTICLPTPVGRTCACEPGVSLHPDGRTCTNLHLCNEIIKQKDQRTNKTLEISFHATCLRRENSTCEYVCPPNYVPVDKNKPTLTCEVDGWDRETHQLCEELLCPATFDNGVVDEGCSKKVGSVCEHFTCDYGYTSAKTEIYCREDGMWHGMEQGICMPSKCNSSIWRGKLDPSCDRSVGSKCSFTCDKYYDFVGPQKVSEITCGANGWSMDTSALCEDAMCDGFMNGIVDPDCVNHVGRSCEYICNNKFTNTTKEVVCKFDQQWHPKEACTSIHCPVEIERGFVKEDCSRTVNSVCRYYCSGIFAPVNLLGNIACLPSGRWNVSKNLCQVPKVTEKEKSEMSVETSFTVIIIILAVIALILIVALLIMWKRKRSTSGFNTGFGDLAVDNPGYTETNFENNESQAYSTIQPTESSEQKYEEVNPSPEYDNEPLPEVSSVDAQQEKAVLTYESWKKEQMKEQNNA